MNSVKHAKYARKTLGLASHPVFLDCCCPLLLYQCLDKLVMDVHDLYSADMSSLPISQIKFIGPTEFAIGDWIGVELDSAEGKNDGTINGVQYFEGREGHGLFVKRAQVVLNWLVAVSLCRCRSVICQRVSYTQHS